MIKLDLNGKADNNDNNVNPYDKANCNHGYGIDPDGYCEACAQRLSDEELIALRAIAKNCQRLSQEEFIALWNDQIAKNKKQN